MKSIKNFLPYIYIITIGLVAVLDLFLHSGEPATFDGPIHITNIASYSLALRDGDFPVIWADTFANYGLPTPLVSQQLTNYLGALIMAFNFGPLTAFKLLFALSSIFPLITTYWLLKPHFKTFITLASITLLNFNPYRLTNVYIRGALPEYFALGFIPLILIFINQTFDHKKFSLIWLTLSISLLILTHPFVFLMSLFIFVPYIIIKLIDNFNFKTTTNLIFSFVVALLLTAWYTLPLTMEMKYFVISRSSNQFVPDQFLTWKNYFQESWQYFSPGDVFVRNMRLQFGLVESIILIGFGLFLFKKTKITEISLIKWIFISVIILVLLTLKISSFLYQGFPLLGNLQFPWRFLGILSIFPAIIFSILAKEYRLHRYLILGFILMVIYIRLPEAYGKNFTNYSADHYFRTIKNLHFDSLNTIWTENTLNYPIKSQKGEIIEGQGQIISRLEKNSYRHYHIKADTKIRLIDNTFYFPGWKVYDNNQLVSPEFQDINYRGVITYWLNPGDHDVVVKLTDTKIRLLSKLISLTTLAGSLLFLIISSIHTTKKSGAIN